MINFAVRRPIAVLMICLGIIALGMIAAKRIPVQLMPNILTPEFTIVVDYIGATPEEIESMVTAPIERSVSTVAGLYKVSSSSDRERAQIKLNFKSNINYLDTISALRDRLDSAGLPEGASRPKILRIQANAAPVIRLALRSKNQNTSDLELARILQDVLIHRLETLDGVAVASLIGAPIKKIEIAVNPVAVSSYGLQFTGLPDVIVNHNKTFPVGSVDFAGTSTSVKLGQSLQSISELQDLIVKQEEGKSVRLGDIAAIREVVEPAEVRSHLDGEGSLVVEVRKEAEANSVVVANAAKSVIEQFLRENSDKLDGKVLFDQGTQIEIAIDNVGESVFHGGILAGLVIFLLLQNWWPTFVVSLSMPISILITFILMYFTGVTFNLMSLAGLALGVGMLVDNSTIVLDNIHLFQNKIKDRKEAAFQGTKTVVGAITGSTIATMAVFAPLAFVEGTIGQMFRDVAATVCYALAASLFSAVFIIPMLSAIEFHPPWNLVSREFEVTNQQWLSQLVGRKYFQGGRLSQLADEWQRLRLIFSFSFNYINYNLKSARKNLFIRLQNQGSGFANRIFTPFLALVSRSVYALELLLKRIIPEYIRHSRKPVTWAIGITLLGLLLLAWRGAELFPDDAADTLVYSLEFPPGQALAVTEQRVYKLEHQLTALKGIRSVSSILGSIGSNQSVLTIQTKESLSAFVNQEVAIRLGREPSLIYTKQKEAMVGEGKPLQIEIYNENLQELKKQTLEVKNLVSQIQGIADLETDVRSDVSEIDVQFAKTRLSWFGVDPMSFISTLRAMLMGLSAGRLQVKGQDLPISIVTQEGYFDSVEKIRDMSVALDEQKKVYLSQVANIKDQRILSSIKRLNRKRLAKVSANIIGADLETVAKHVKSELEKKFKSGDLNWKLGGQDEERERSQKSLIGAVIISIFLIYLMLAAQFENLIQPVIILCAVPFCISGVAAFLILFGLNVSAMVFVGFIILVGVSVNTSIVMVDFANQMVLEGKTVPEAIADATVRRMRPILVTTLSGILGLLPMALAIGPGSAMQQPLAVTMIGGHISSTILTVVIVPIIYTRLAKAAKIEIEK